MHETNFFMGYSPIEEANTSKPKPIIMSKDRKYIVDSGASLHMMGRSFLSPQEKKTLRPTEDDLKIQTAYGIRSTKEARTYIHELGTHLHVTLVRDSPSRYCLLTDCAMSWRVPILGNQDPDIKKRQEDHHVLHSRFRSSRCGHSAESHSICQARPRKEKSCAR